jgi:ribose transport system substrate-binding protein
MTTQMDVPAKTHRTITPFRVLVTLILIGLLAWNLGLFKRAPRVVIITSGEGHYWDAVENGANRAADDYGVKLTVIRCKSELLPQLDAIKQATGDRYDAIAISPINPDGEATLMADVGAKMPLVTLDSDSPVARRICFIGTDNYDAGRLCGQMVRDAMPDGGQVVIALGNSEKENTQRRRQGVIDELLQRPFLPERPADAYDAELKGGNFEIVATLAAGSEAAVATDMAAKAIKDHPNVKCLIGLLSYSAPALAKAVDDSGKTGQIKVVGFDVSDDTLAGIDAGRIAGTVMQDQFGCGYQTVHALADCARGVTAELPVFGKKILSCRIVKKDNLEDARRRLNGTTATTQQG